MRPQRRNTKIMVDIFLYIVHFVHGWSQPGPLPSCWRERGGGVEVVASSWWSHAGAQEGLWSALNTFEGCRRLACVHKS